MNRSAKTVIPALIAAFVLSGACGSSLKTKLVGKWNNTSAKTVWEFKSDGTVQVISKDANGQESVLGAGTYRVVDGETIELRFPNQREASKVNVQSLPQGQLKLSGAGAPPFVLTPIS